MLVLETHFSRRQKVKQRYLKVLFVALVLVVAALVMIAPAGAQANKPSIKVSDQVVLDGTVTIDEVVAAADGWVVLRNDPGRGDPGPVLGHAAVKKGTNTNVKVPLGVFCGFGFNPAVLPGVRVMP